MLILKAEFVAAASYGCGSAVNGESTVTAYKEPARRIAQNGAPRRKRSGGKEQQQQRPGSPAVARSSSSSGQAGRDTTANDDVTSAVAIVTSAVAIGFSAVAICSSAVAICSSAVAFDSSAVAFGFIAVAIGFIAVVISFIAVAIGFIAVAIIFIAVAIGFSDEAIDYRAVAFCFIAVAIGYSAVANSFIAVAITFIAVAIGFSDEAIDYSAVAIGSSAVVLGSSAVNFGSSAVACPSIKESYAALYADVPDWSYLRTAFCEYTGDDLRDDCNVARTKLLDGAIKMTAGMLLGQYITEFRNNLLFAGNNSMCQPLLAMVFTRGLSSALQPAVLKDLAHFKDPTLSQAMEAAKQAQRNVVMLSTTTPAKGAGSSGVPAVQASSALGGEAHPGRRGSKPPVSGGAGKRPRHDELWSKKPLLPGQYCFKCNHPGHLTNHPCPFRHFTAIEARRRSGYPHPPEGAKKPGQAKSKPPSESGASESDQEPEPQPPPKAAKPRDQGMRRGVSRARIATNLSGPEVVYTPLSAKTAAKWLKDGGTGVVALVSYENLQDPPGVPPEQAAQLKSLLMEFSDVFEPITGQQKRRLQEGEDVGAGTPLGSGSGGSEQQPTAGSDPDHDADSDDALKPSEPKRLRWADPVSNDFGVHGYDSIFVVVDRLSKMVHLIPCIEAMDAKEFAELYIDHVFKYHGLSKVTISDRGATFNNQFWIEVRKLIGVDPAFSTAYHPQSDGQTERTNQIVEEMLRHYILPTQEDWPRHLAFAEFAINNSWQESIQSTPFLVNYGQSPITPMLHKLPRPCLSPSAESFAKKWEHEVKHAQECMRVAQDRQQRYANKRRRDVTFSVGDSVLLSTKNLRNAPGRARKFLPRYVGPFKVTGKLGEAAYRLELPSTMSRLHPVFHVSLLKKYTGSQGFHPPPVMEWLEDAPHYEVHSLLNHRQVRFKKRMEYLVKWTGYDDTYNTWEQEAMLAGAPQILSSHLAQPHQHRAAVVPHLSAQPHQHQAAVVLHLSAHMKAYVRNEYQMRQILRSAGLMAEGRGQEGTQGKDHEPPTPPMRGQVVHLEEPRRGAGPRGRVDHAHYLRALEMQVDTGLVVNAIPKALKGSFAVMAPGQQLEVSIPCARSYGRASKAKHVSKAAIKNRDKTEQDYT
ncbi:hypothetical protein QJQ45_009121 [Haematococcus lacustris]|nr:hypothetical protein QJQ45_009121 [Haematococcus lacustris]